VRAAAVAVGRPVTAARQPVPALAIRRRSFGWSRTGLWLVGCAQAEAHGPESCGRSLHRADASAWRGCTRCLVQGGDRRSVIASTIASDDEQHLARSPLPHLHRDRAHPCHICAGTGLAPSHNPTGNGPTRATSAPGLGPPLPHLRRDRAHRCRIFARTVLTAPLTHLHRDWAPLAHRSGAESE
jgi:hypothetical protein